MLKLKNHKIWREGSGEKTPFRFHGKMYTVENVMFSTIAKEPVRYNFHEDFTRIRDSETGLVINHVLINHYFTSAFVKDDWVYLYAIDYGTDLGWWKSKSIDMIRSKDLMTWSAPVPVLHAEGEEQLFNNSVCFDGKRYVMVFETNNKAYTPFTFFFAESEDLLTWKKIPGTIYGPDKYVGGPTLFFANGWFYLTYVNRCIDGDDLWYDTRIARTKDLIHWEDSPEPVLEPDRTRETAPGVREINASDAEFLEEDGIVKVFWAGGNQQGVLDEQYGEYEGTLAELLESFFE